MNQNINPEKVTKPIQLLAVWFIGLIFLVGTLLTGAAQITSPHWIPPLLCISAVAIIPIFLIFVFLLQTKFRPQLQADEFYQTYLDKQTNKEINITKENKILLSHHEDNFNLPQLEKQRELLQEKSKLLQLEIKQIKNSISEVVQKSDTNTLVQKVEDTANQINEIAKKSQFEIELNTLLKYSQEINNLLLINGYIVNPFIGGSKKPPRRKTISFGYDIKPNDLYDILILLSPFQFEYVSLIINDPFEDDYRNTVFIGSYVDTESSEDRTVVDLDTALLSKIKDISTIKTLHEFFK